MIHTDLPPQSPVCLRARSASEPSLPQSPVCLRASLPQSPVCLRARSASEPGLPQSPVCLRAQSASEPSPPQSPVRLRAQSASEPSPPQSRSASEPGLPQSPSQSPVCLSPVCLRAQSASAQSASEPSLPQSQSASEPVCLRARLPQSPVRLRAQSASEPSSEPQNRTVCFVSGFQREADSGGATPFADVEKVEVGLYDVNTKPENMAISFGSRAHLEEEAVASRSMFRTFLMYGFHFLVWFFCVRGIKDTQCGFKLFTRDAALNTFSSLHVERWAFDVELLYIAQRFNIPIAEVAVNWTEVEGSKLVPVWSWLQMGRDLVFIRLHYITGAWRLESPRKTA
ncbi:LOW QUALITY PROTEIN: dolichyl-phosphate beta-glucosyltransferase-like [Salmo salar]|uniref:LOW QUALITY PROTEIN: dolichyl-phosphate beta-glucosyltransferase-like n=1 Tax=Salmo salar TaxID=8030 RepID=A0ABM3EMD7_SALSA|nr:LOW QUALITY PROTEIN: dolichyl-phosphate beta-glucosyltransferase-like [Salmo salar]